MQFKRQQTHSVWRSLSLKNVCFLRVTRVICKPSRVATSSCSNHNLPSRAVAFGIQLLLANSDFVNRCFSNRENLSRGDVACDLLDAVKPPRPATRQRNTLSLSKSLRDAPLAMRFRKQTGTLPHTRRRPPQASWFGEPPPAEGLRKEETENAATGQIVYLNPFTALPSKPEFTH